MNPMAKLTPLMSQLIELKLLVIWNVQYLYTCEGLLHLGAYQNAVIKASVIFLYVKNWVHLVHVSI